MDVKKQFADAMRILCESKVLSYAKARTKAGALCAWNTGLDVTAVDKTWNSCNFRYRVFVRHDFMDFEKVLSTLREWFGDADFFWADNHGVTMYLCTKKY